MAAITFLLVGRSGNGKSSIGNSILGTKAFTPRSSSSSATYEIKKEVKTIKDKTITIVDGLSIGDTSSDGTDNAQVMIELAQKALSLTSHTLHALLLTLKYGVRFTKQEQDTVMLVKAIFGEDVIKNYGVIVMSYGDSFDLDMEDEETTFETWCGKQSGDVQVLFQECNNRLVLFNNRTKDEDVQNKQNEQLMKMVAAINRQPYNEDDFKKAEQGRKKLLVMGQLSKLDSETELVLNVVTEQLGRIGKDDASNYARNIQELENISGDLQKHIQFLEETDQNTGSIDSLIMKIYIFKNRIKTMIDLQRLKLKNAEQLQDKYTIIEPTSEEKRPNLLQRLIEGIMSCPWRSLFSKAGCCSQSHRMLPPSLMLLFLGVFLVFKYRRGLLI